jgi:DNA-binding transcriptional LysR family regulator
MQIKALEQQVGRPLFRRSATGAVPTAAGRELAQAVARHVDALEAAMAPVGADEATGITGSVHIGGPEEFLTARILPALQSSLERGTRLRMYLGVDAPVLERLRSSELDMAILTADARSRGVETLPLCYERLELVAAPHVAAEIGPVPCTPEGASRLDGTAVAAYDEDLPLVRVYWQAVFGRPAHLRAAFIANSLQASLQFALRGHGITVLPTHTVAESLTSGQLIRVAEPPSPPRSRLYLAWRSGTLRNPVTAAAHEQIVAAAERW